MQNHETPVRADTGPWLLTVIGAAEYLRVSKSFLDKARLTGSGPTYFKLGRAVRYRQQALDDWLSQRQLRNTSQTVGAL